VNESRSLPSQRLSLESLLGFKRVAVRKLASRVPERHAGRADYHGTVLVGPTVSGPGGTPVRRAASLDDELPRDLAAVSGETAELPHPDPAPVGPSERLAVR
jgi:hypothetical protein